MNTRLSKPTFFLTFLHRKFIVLSDFSSNLFRFHIVAENKLLTACQHACTGLAVFKLPSLKPNLGKSIAG